MTWICLVDDDPEVRDALTELLRGAGYGVLAYRDGAEAIEALDAAFEMPRLVILDHVLVRMTGKEVVKHLRSGQRARYVPVLVVTGMDLDAAFFLPWGVQGVLRKPVAGEDLLRSVAAVIAAKPAG